MAEKFERHRQPWRQDEIQKLTDRHVHDIDQVLAEKEKELLQV